MKVFPMKDSNDTNTIIKSSLCNLPTRSLMIGASGLGKSSLLGWLMCNEGEKGWKDHIKPENIYIFSGSYKNGKGDEKLDKIIKYLEIPEENIFDSYDNDVLNELYEVIVDNYNDAIEEKEKPEHSLIIMDDLGFTNKLKKNIDDSALDRIFCNGRKFLVSTIILNQRIIQCSPTVITQANNVILFKPNNRDLELYETNFNYLESKKLFNKMVRQQTENKHDYMVIDLSKNKKEIYRDKEFEPIKFCECEGKKNECGGLK
jgi:hypothetical protein